MKLYINTSKYDFFLNWFNKKSFRRGVCNVGKYALSPNMSIYETKNIFFRFVITLFIVLFIGVVASVSVDMIFSILIIQHCLVKKCNIITSKNISRESPVYEYFTLNWSMFVLINFQDNHLKYNLYRTFIQQLLLFQYRN